MARLEEYSYKRIRDINRGVIGMDLVERGWGKLPSLSEGAVVVTWKEMPEEYRRAGYFKLVVGDKTVVLNKHDLQFLLRNV